MNKEQNGNELYNQLIKTKRYRTKMKLIEKYLAIMCLCLMLTSCFTGKSAVDYHKGLQSHYNFEAAMKRNTGFTLEGAKDQLKEAKKSAEEAEKKEKEQAKIAKIRAKIKELKKDNQ